MKTTISVVTLVFFLLTFMTAPSICQGQSPDKRRGSALKSDSEKTRKMGEELFLAAMHFRKMAAHRFETAIDSTNGGQNLYFMTQVPEYERNSDAWSFFFTGSYILSSSPGQTFLIVSYYNPLHDAALIVRWQSLDDKTIAIESGTLVTGEWRSTLDNEALHRPRWMQTDNGSPKLMREQTQSFVRLFEKHFPPDQAPNLSTLPSSNTKLVDSVFALCRLQMESLVALRHPEFIDLQRALNAFRNAVASGEKQAITHFLPVASKETGEVLAETPLIWRSRLIPMLVMPSNDLIGVILSDPDTPGFYLTIFYHKKDWMISSLSMTSIGELKGEML